MLRSLSSRALALVVAGHATGCSLFLAQAEEAPAGPPVITSVEGVGTERAVLLEGFVPEDAVFSARRVGDRFVVNGENLDQIETVVVENGAGGVATVLDFTVESPVRITIASSALFQAGALTLVLGGAFGEVRAQVFVLQGEQGPAGVSPLSEIVPPGDDDGCVGNRGRVLLVAADKNGNGIIDEEGDEVLSRFVDCDEHVREEVTIEIATERELQDALRALDTVDIERGGEVTIDLGGRSVLLTGPIVFQHDDGARITLANGTLIVPEGSDAVVVTTGLRIDRVTLLTEGGASDGTGLAAIDGGRVEIGSQVTVSGFFVGVEADGAGSAVSVTADPDNVLLVENAFVGVLASRNGVVEARRARIVGGRPITGSLIGAFAIRGGGVDLQDASCSGAHFACFSAEENGWIDVTDAGAAGGVRHAQAGNGGVIAVNRLESSGAEQALLANEGGVIFGDNALIGESDAPLVAESGGQITLLGDQTQLPDGVEVPANTGGIISLPPALLGLCNPNAENFALCLQAIP